MKRKPAKRTSKKAKPTKQRLHRAFAAVAAAVAAEMQASPHELAGLLLQRAQVIETQMMLYIVSCDSSKTIESLERSSFGQVLTVFKKHSQDQVLNDWLESMRLARNDVAHTYFHHSELTKREFGPVVTGLNHGVLRKMLRISEMCYGSLSKLRKQSS
jgi:hypothetical protein